MVAPWTVIRADDKLSARISLIRDLLTQKEESQSRPPRSIPTLSSAFTGMRSAMGRSRNEAAEAARILPRCSFGRMGRGIALSCLGL
ncbi:hypothetical protein ABTE34_20555, partial [Acinetobacter baumannii]